MTKLDVNVGEEIFQTTEIATIKNTNVIDFIAEVDETDILKVQIGQTAAITLDSQPDTQIKSSVKSISPDAAVTTTGATAYRVKLEIPDNNPPLGANGQVTIDVAKVSSVLVVPIEAVIDDRFIWIKQDNSYRKKEITTGLVTDTQTEVTEGIEEGQQIVTSGFEQIGKKSLWQKIIGVLK